METKLEKEVRFLKIYALVMTLGCCIFFLTAFAVQNKNQKFDEIDVERINIVEKDGKLKMVISNQERQHPGIVNGKIIKRDGPRPPGMIFFNQIGDEMGGMVFGANGDKGHFGSLTWDKFKNDQTIGFRHLEGDNGTYETGLAMWQQPNIPNDIMMEKFFETRKITNLAERQAATEKLIANGEYTASRLFLGKRRDNSSELLMSDTKGKPRIRMQVAPDGSPKLEFLDEAGKIIYSLPEENKAGKK